METDRELLELAAKAVGMRVLRDGETVPIDRKYWFFNQVGGNPPAMYDAGSPSLTMWAPLTDDGDALRLAVKLRIDILQRGTWKEAQAVGPMTTVYTQLWGDDPNAATRRAIVRAAAEVGRKRATKEA